VRFLHTVSCNRSGDIRQGELTYFEWRPILGGHNRFGDTE
jgi:hypothetical protein